MWLEAIPDSLVFGLDTRPDPVDGSLTFREQRHAYATLIRWRLSHRDKTFLRQVPDDSRDARSLNTALLYEILCAHHAVVV